MTQNASPHVTIDARGLNCPLPVLRLNKRLRDVPAGAAIVLLATDRAALRDVPAYCAAHGHAVQVSAADSCLTFTVTKAG